VAVVAALLLTPELVFPLDLLDVSAVGNLDQNTLVQKFLDIGLAGSLMKSLSSTPHH
jgi:hypothetical protein